MFWLSKFILVLLGEGVSNSSPPELQHECQGFYGDIFKRGVKRITNILDYYGKIKN
ncbi:hypothetical protein ACSYAY_08760 [Leptospirillum ferriphilum]|jgi:uncharacterized protein YaaN involved in tellurite resistance|uniref:Uncharacterized protein n=1 Tax=Leptospirillum ferriphilum TaxID=178606 RepID=A0A094X4Z8_9BACT|nr:hypothetical protein LptCag_0247 [Leptospirillum ferriphilum]